jgi:hypothetical protein
VVNGVEESISRFFSPTLRNLWIPQERLKVKTEGSTYLTYTGFRGELEHLKIETTLIDKRFDCCVMGECKLNLS